MSWNGQGYYKNNTKKAVMKKCWFNFVCWYGWQVQKASARTRTRHLHFGNHQLYHHHTSWYVTCVKVDILNSQNIKVFWLVFWSTLIPKGVILSPLISSTIYFPKRLTAIFICMFAGHSERSRKPLSRVTWLFHKTSPRFLRKLEKTRQSKRPPLHFQG